MKELDIMHCQMEESGIMRCQGETHEIVQVFKGQDLIDQLEQIQALDREGVCVDSIDIDFIIYDDSIHPGIGRGTITHYKNSVIHPLRCVDRPVLFLGYRTTTDIARNTNDGLFLEIKLKRYDSGLIAQYVTARLAEIRAVKQSFHK